MLPKSAGCAPASGAICRWPQLTLTVTATPYTLDLIRFSHNGLRQPRADDNPRGVGSSMAEKLRKPLFALETAVGLDQLRRLPGWKLHPLKGGLKGFGSLTVTGNWRFLTTIRRSTMPMKNPPHPGGLIRTGIIEALGLSVSKAAVILRVRRATLSDLLHAKAALTPEMAFRIEKAFGPDMNHLLRMQIAYAVAEARRHANDIGVERYVPA